jgi:cell division protein FtsW (lipid II flippase)
VVGVKIEFEIDLNTFKHWRRYARPRPILAILVATLLVIGHPDLVTIIMGAYVVVALIVNIEAQWSFVLALITLASLPLWLILQKPAIGNHFAVNAFYFLVCGLVTSLTPA